MKKSMKFIYEHFLRVVVLLSILVCASGSVHAAVLATGETITFILDDSNINSSDGWNGSPFIYAWDSSNNRLTGDWPGTKIPGKSYTFVAGQTIPAGVIFSAEFDWGGNKGKTADIIETFEPNTIYTIKLTGSFSGNGNDRIFAHTIETKKKCTDYATTIYFKNTVGWCNVYAYLYDGEYWGDNGSGSKNIKAGPIEMDLCTGSGTDAIYRVDLSDYSLAHSGYISFTEDGQKDYDNFHNTKAAYRGDLCGNNKMFVPNTTSNTTKNETVYYSSGSWETYSGTCDAIVEDEFYGTMMCDANNTTTIFWEKFTFESTPYGDDSRSDYSVSNAKYTAYVPSNYDYVSGHCTAMRSEGTYAMVVNSKNAGCYDNVHGKEDCGCENAGSNRWFRDITGNTVNLDSNTDTSKDGMLLFNCGNGSGCNPDVLYECIVNDICPNTFINFSAYVTAANTGTHGNIDVKAEFRLYNADDETRPLAIRKVDNVPLNSDWQQISAMFNSGTATRVKVQLVNKAPAGQGNDLLLDDITFSVCTPKADLKCSNGNTEITVVAGNTETLTSSFTSGLMRNPYYLWQFQNPLTGAWLNLAPAEQNKTTFTITPDSPTLLYRVIIAPTVDDIYKILNDRNSDIPCGMYAITNVATIDVTISDLELTTSITDGNICVDGVDNNVLTLKLKNPRLVNATGVKVTLENIEGLEIVKRSGLGNYANGVWTVGTLQASSEVIIYLNVKSSTSVASSLPKVIKAFVSFVDSERYASYDSAPVESKATTTITLNPVPKAPTVVPYDECAKSGDVALLTLATGTNLKFYSDASLTTLATKFPASTAVKDAKYYVTQTNTYGCISPSATINVTVKENPTLNSVLLDKTAICGTDANSKAVLTYNISGGLAPYTLYIDRTEAGVTETVNPNNLSTTGTRELKPSSDATYKFTKVVDANSCESTSDKTLSIDVQAINVTANISDVNVCADKTKLFKVEASGDNLNYKWSESTNGGETFSQVGTNSNEYTTGTFSMGDQKQYKVEVYQNSKVCKAVEGLSNVTVQDCSGFEIDYSAVTSATVCKGNNITLKVTLTNNADEAANYVDVKITNISNQTLVSRNPSVGSYTHNTGIWSIPSLASDATATLTIEIKGNVVATDLVSKAYVVKSGSTSYTEATTKADDSQSITIKDITLAPTLISETYKDCPKVGMLNLSTQVSSDATSLKFYTTETGSNTATQANTNTIGTTTYWVSNTKVGECESPRTKLDIVVYPQPTATLSGSSTICKGESANLTVQLTGKENYIITLSNGDIKPNVSGSSTQMAVSPDLTTNYTLRNVTDGNGCVATLSGSAKVTVNDVPVIEFTENPLPEYCAGVEYTLPTPNVDNKGSNVTESAWYLADNKLSSNKIKFTTDDNAKSLIYKAKNTCGETTATFVASLNVADCAELTLTYSLDKSSYCEEDDAVLTATLYNGSALDLNNVVVTNSWTGKQTSVLSEVSKGTYNNNTWTINKLTKGETVTLTISFKVVEAEEFKIYVSQANGETYTFDTSVAKSTTQLVVKHFSSNVTVNNYINCPIDANSFLITDLVTSDKNDLKVWTKNAATGLYEKVNEVPTINPNQTTPAATYYITNTERGKCESTTPTPITIEIYKPVKASISGLSPLCSGEISNVNITLEGTPEFTVVYNNGTADITQKTSETTLNIAESLSSTTTYKLVSVTDINNCSAYLNGTELVTVTVNPRPELVSFEIEDSDDIICEGESTNLKATFTGTAPFTFKINGEEKTSDANEWSMTISDAKEYVITDLSDANCSAETISNNSVTLIVEELPELTLSATDVTLNCTTSTATITASGASTYEWSYLDQTGATQTKSGATLALQQTDLDVSSLVTEYTVYGYSENANCKSEEAKTVKVTEDFVKPVVDIKISETADGTIPERLDCYQQNIKLEADLTNNKETIVEYIWSSGSDNNTTLINNPGAYTLQVKGENGCISDVATETIEQNIVKPEVSIESYITDPVTGNIIPTVELTCANNEITLEGTITNAEQYAEDYPNGEFTYLWSDGSTTSSTVAKTPLATSPMEYTLIVKSPNGCLNDVDKAKVTVTENVSAPVLNIESVYELCPSDTLTTLTLSSFLPKIEGVTYKFYDESGEEIEDVYEVSSESSATKYFVAGKSDNGCISDTLSFSVDFAKNVDFTLTTSQSSMMVGGNETIVEIVPDADSDDAATYVWTANDQELSVDGLQYVDNLYLDTNFKVTASNRCDSDTQEAFVEVLWPTAFTPHNGNGKNDTFAKGMHIIVFNRFYTKIFEGEDGWDGSINGTMNSSKQTAVPGVYFYSVQLPNGQVKKGTIEIVKVD